MSDHAGHWALGMPRPGWLSWTISALFAIGVFLVFSHEISFPYFYHPDEVNKVVQIVDGRRDFHHPLLMLNSASVAWRLAGSPQSLQRTVEIGRLVNVAWGALAVGLFCATAGMLAGPAASLACGIVLCLDFRLVELLHYFKEEMTLSFGLAAFCFTAVVFARRANAATAVLLGISCALALSAKYVGVVCVPFALALLLASGERRWKFVGIFALSLVTVALAINIQALIGAGSLAHGVQSEVDLFEASRRPIPNPKAFRFIVIELSPFGWLAILLFAGLPWLLRIRPVPAHWALLTLPLVSAGLLLLSSRVAGRYLLPITLLVALQAGVVIGWLTLLIPARTRLAGTAIGMLLAVLAAVGFQWSQLSDARKMFEGFRVDNRMNLARFIQSSLPATAKIVEDNNVKLPGSGDRSRRLDDFILPQAIMAPAFGRRLDSMGDLAALRSRGVTHVVVYADREARKSMDGGQGIWGELKRAGKLLWQCDDGTPSEMQPPLQLYEIGTTNP